MKKLWALITIAVIIGILLLVLRSEWLARSIRTRIVAEIESATGARATLDDFAFSWQTLTATFDGLTLHGTEPDSGPALFHADRIRIRLRAQRLLTGALRISELAIDRPFVYLLERPDGSTNLPALQTGSHVDVSDIIRLHVGRVTVSHGTFQINDRRVPLDFSAQETGFLAQYQRNTRRYDLSFQSKQIAVALGGRTQPSASLSFAGKLTANQLSVDSLTLQTGNTSVAFNGYLRNFDRPNLDLNTSATVSAPDVATAADISWLRSGRITLNGTVHYDSAANLSFTGTAQGADVTYQSGRVRVPNGSFTAHVLATPDLIDVSQLRANAIGGSAVGELRFVNLRQMLFRGSVDHLDARGVLNLILEKPLPFTAAVTGPVTLDTQLGVYLTKTTITGDVKLASPDGPNGSVSLVYQQDGERVTFGPSAVSFPQSLIKFSGQLNSSLQLDATTSSLADVQPTLQWLGLTVPAGVGLAAQNAQATFNGEVDGDLTKPVVKGNLHAQNLIFGARQWSFADVTLNASSSLLTVTTASLVNGDDRIHVSGSTTLNDWDIDDTSQVRLRAFMRNADFAAFAKGLLPHADIFAGGNGTLRVNVSGTPHNLSGTTVLALKDLSVWKQPIAEVQAAIDFSGTEAAVKTAQIRSGGATVTLRAQYQHSPRAWTDGRLHIQADTNRFSLQTLGVLRNHIGGLAAQTEVHANGDFAVHPQEVEPLAVNGTLALRDITVGALRRGDLTFDAGTEGDLLTLGLAGNLEGSPVAGNLRSRLVGQDEAEGNVTFGKLSLATAMALLTPGTLPRNWEGFFNGNWHFRGPLRNWHAFTSKLVVDKLQLRSSSPLPGGVSASDFELSNSKPVIIETAGAVATISQLDLATRDTQLSVSGSIDLAGNALHLQATGQADLRLAELVRSDWQTAGTASMSVDVSGSRQRPIVRGEMSINDGSLAVPELTNTLTGIHGTVRFDQRRAVVDKISGQTGGGTVELTGVASFGGTEQATYNLNAQASHVRFRYLRSSVTGDAKLRMTGTTQNGLIAGDVTISRVVLEPGADLANLFASAALPTATPVNQQEFLTGLGYDIRLQSAPDLQVVTSLSQDLQANIDLRLRGTREHPVLLGQISANQGEVNVFGTRYTLSRGNVTFINPVRIDPVFDLDLQTETRGITVDVIVTGTMNKLSMNYRSDPPLQAKEILALLTVGQAPTFAPEASNTRIQADTSALQAGATSVLGQAISPASGRLQKLFGITNVKIDPFIQNEYNNRQARLTLEEQVSRNITVTYVTNLAQTSEQIFRFEWSFNPQYSLVAVRDDNGEFGIDIQYKRRFK